MADMFDDLLQAVGVKNDEIRRTSETLKEIQGVQVQEQRFQLENLTKAALSGTALVTAVEQAKLEADNKTRTFAANLGTNADDASYVLNALATDARSAAVDSAVKNKELSRAASSKLSDDPIQWIKDQFTLEYKEEEAKTANQRSQSAQNNLSNLQALTQQAAGTQQALAKTRSDSIIQLGAEKMTAESAAKLNEIRIQNAGVNMTGIEKLQSLSLQQLNNLYTAYNASRQEKSFELQAAQAELSRKSLQLSIDARTEALEQKQEDKAENESLANLVRKGAAVYGYEGVAAFPTNKILQMIKLKDPKVSQYLEAGMKTEAIGYPVVSENVGDAAFKIATQGAPLRPEQSQIKEFLNSVWRDGANANPGAKAEQIVGAVAKVATQSANSQAKNIKAGDNSNIYSPPPLPTVLALPQIQSSKLFKSVFADQMSTGALKEFNSDQIVSMTVEGIKAGKISINDASEGLQGIFNGAVSINNVSRNYPGFGLPMQKSFNTDLTSGAGFSRRYDLTKKQSIDQILNSKMSKIGAAVGAFGQTDNPFGGM